jgi:hypothetical protein
MDAGRDVLRSTPDFWLCPLRLLQLFFGFAMLICPYRRYSSSRHIAVGNWSP